MGEQNYKPAVEQKSDDLDRALDTALAQYSAVEPRAGLEQRIMANLRGAQKQDPASGWWRWQAVAAVAATALIVTVLAWRSNRQSHPAIAEDSAATIEPSRKSPIEVASNGAGSAVLPQTRRTRKVTYPTRSAAKSAGEPKLDRFPSLPPSAEGQFPSPRPLSEQERILASYVSQFPTQAVLTARAQTELLEREEKEVLEKYGPPPAGVEPQNRQLFDVPNL